MDPHTPQELVEGLGAKRVGIRRSGGGVARPEAGLAGCAWEWGSWRDGPRGTLAQA